MLEVWTILLMSLLHILRVRSYFTLSLANFLPWNTSSLAGKPLDLQSIVTGWRQPCLTHVHYRVFPVRWFSANNWENVLISNTNVMNSTSFSLDFPSEIYRAQVRSWRTGWLGFTRFVHEFAVGWPKSPSELNNFSCFRKKRSCWTHTTELERYLFPSLPSVFSVPCRL